MMRCVRLARLLLALAAIVASSVAFGGPCFDTKIVLQANARLGLEKRWEGIEAAPFNLGTVVTQFLSPDGSRWALWAINGDEGCLIAKGIEWHRKTARPALR